MKAQSNKKSFVGETVALIDLCHAVSDCPHYTPNWTSEGGLVIRNFNIKKGRLDLTEKYYTDEKTFKDRIRRHKPESGDLIISREAPMGEVCVIPENVECCLGQRTVLIKPNFKKVNNQFLLYSIISDFVQHQIKKSDGSGSIVSNLCIPDLEQLQIPIVELKEQEKIATILSTLDKKIELNNSINAELEILANTIYNFWFVQFDFPDKEGKPYQTSGGEMEWNEELKREIPKGWEVKRLSEITTQNHTPCDEDEYLNADIIDLSSMPSNSISLNDKSNAGSFKTNLFKLKKMDILFGSIRPYLNKAGIAPFDGAVNGTIHSYLPKSKSDYSFLVCSLINKNTFKYAFSHSKGTKMPVIESDELLKLSVPYSKAISLKFNDNVYRYWELIISNVLQTQELITLRNFLLPLLMNGQVKVK